MNALKRLFVFVVNFSLWLPRFLYVLVWWVGATLIAGVLAFAYAVTFPFVLVHWLATHPVFFNIFRVALVAGMTYFMFLMAGAPPADHPDYWTAVFIAGFVGLFLYGILFKKDVLKSVVRHHRPFAKPSPDIKKIIHALPSLAVPFEFLRYDPPPISPPPPFEPEPKTEYYAQATPEKPQSVEEARQNVPEHLRELMK